MFSSKYLLFSILENKYIYIYNKMWRMPSFSLHTFVIKYYREY